MHVLQIIFVISEENKLLFPYPPHLKNVTALPCKMHNFFIWLKMCCIPPNVGGSEKKPVVGWHWWLWKEPVVMCGKWNVRQANVQSDHLLHGYILPVFFATHQLHHPPRCAKIQPMSQCFRNSSISQIGTWYAWKNEKDEKLVHLQDSAVTFFRCGGKGVTVCFLLR